MKASIILCSAIAMAAILPATLFAQTPPVEQAQAAVVAAATAIVKAAAPVAVRPAAKLATVRNTAAKVAQERSSSKDLKAARAVLASLQARYNYLDGVTVTIGKTPGGYQAVSYYTKGKIVISTKHKATISRIMKHEIWHIIDWRDNDKINWRESVPPNNAASYLK